MVKQKSFSAKVFFKILAIITLALTGVVGVVVGILALVGVFKPEHIALTRMNFESGQYFIQDETYITISPTPINTTEKIVMLTISDMQVISAPTEVEVGVPFKVTPIKTNGINNGGSAKITASYNNLIFCEATVFVDVPVQTIEIKNKNEFQTDIIAGTSLSLGLTYTEDKSVTPYGTNYDYTGKSKAYTEPDNGVMKVATYKIIEGNSVATINAETGEVTTLKAGTFKVEAKSFKTYQAKQEYEQHKLAGDFNEDEWGIGKVDGKTEAEYLAERIVIATKTFTVREINLTSITVNQPQNDNYIQDIYLYETINLTYEELGLTLTPETSSGLTSADMISRFKDVSLTAVKGTNHDDNSDVLEVTDYCDPQGKRIGWSIKALKYQDRIVSKTAIKFEISRNGVDEEDVLETTYALNIKENKIVDGTFVLTSGSSIAETKYTSNLNFFTYQNTKGTENEIVSNIVKDGFDLKQTTTIQFNREDKPRYCVVRYFVKDFGELDYANRVIEYDEETGEILDGMIVILREGSVQIEAKALKIDEEGNIIYEEETDKTSYKVIATANATSASGISTPLTINVIEKLTNVKLELETDENTIYVDYIENEETKQALRESQTIKVKISAYDFASQNDAEGLRETYETEKLIEMLENNKLEFVIENGEKFENIGISYNIITGEENSKQISAQLFIPNADFKPINNQIPQLLQKNITFKLQLTEEAKAEYGNHTFENGELVIDVQTARAKEIKLETNANQGTLYYDENGQNVRYNEIRYVKYVQGSWVVGDEQEAKKLEVYAQFDPLKTAVTEVKIESSNESLLTINNDSASITADAEEQEKRKNPSGSTGEVQNESAENSEWAYKYLYSAQLNLLSPSALEGYTSVFVNTNGYYTEYKYIGNVTLTFTSTDTTYKIDDGNGNMRDVYAEITFHLIASIQ